MIVFLLVINENDSIWRPRKNFGSV